MARGENEHAPDRSIGIAIFAVFLVVCGLVAYVVARAVQPPPEPEAPPELHADWRAVLGNLRSRGCSPPTGLAVGATVSPADSLERELLGRGYVALGPWSEPQGFPLTTRATGLDGACGLVSVLTEGGVVQQIGTDPTSLLPPCRGELGAVAVCDDTTVVAQGWGEARTRTFALPGLDRAAAEATELPLEVLLAHLEVELALARSGWRPSPTIWFHESAPGTTPSVLPPTPASDCEPWVVVGLGAEHASSYFEGTQLAHDMSPRRFVVPFVHCATAPSQISYTTVDRPRLYWRRYRPGTAPPTLGAPSLGAMPRVVTDVVDLVAP
ncbi:MAG: hypothetical protein H6722_13860 [Sandaracinus sp.]|nr:hypothetical protein [Sandaracinus sp.]